MNDLAESPSEVLHLRPSDIRLQVEVLSKEEAIEKVAALLAENGCIEPDYARSMLAREKQANTCLGNGIAIPHGKPEDRGLILKTGVVVLQLAQPVEWNPGQNVRLVVGIAAKSDEHLGILAALTDVLDDPAKAETLATTDDPQDIIEALQRGSSEASETIVIADGALTAEAVIVNQHGLHARPASVLVQIATTFQSDIRLHSQGKTANAKAVASLLKLGAGPGTVLQLEASGPDAATALSALQEAIASGLGDEDAEPVAPPAPVSHWQPTTNLATLAGVSACPGLAIGPVHHFQAGRIIVADTPKDPQTEELAFQNALADAATQLRDLADSMAQRTAKSDAAIFRAHLALLEDEELRNEVNLLIDAGHSAAWSFQETTAKRAAEMSVLENEHLAARAADWLDIGQRVLRLLVGDTGLQPGLPDHPVILLADDLAPSETVRLDPTRILGLCTALGGPTSHTAILARSLDIPALVGMGVALQNLKNGERCVLDSSAGRLYLQPTESDVSAARLFQETLKARRNIDHVSRYQPAVLTDGHRVEVVANIGKASEAIEAIEAGGEGVGLLRTEFLFLGRNSAPDEEEQFETYATIIRHLRGLPLIIRTLDIGGDKVVPYISVPKEENPFLGMRGIRLCMSQPELFLPQLRAIYRASLLGPVKIMFPMISTLEDFSAAKELAEHVRKEINAPPVPIGIMVEVPSAALLAGEFAKVVDFFSIGTNDLTQYTLAIDRMHASLGKSVDGLHPAVLQLIALTVKAAEAAGKWVGVCGGIAGEPLGAAILTGLGVSELSVSPPAIPGVKAALRRLSLVQVRKLAIAALACSTTHDVRQLSLP